MKFRPLNLDDEPQMSNTKNVANLEPMAKNTTKTKKPENKTQANNITTKTSSKNAMPPIVIDGKASSQNTLIKDLKGMVKGDFSVKHSNYSTIFFVDKKDDHDNVLNNIKNKQLPYHTYTAREDKSHASVLRGLAEGTKI